MANNQTTHYIPGLAEYTIALSYYLADEQQTVRQITNAQGVVTLTRSFTPWGELLALSGTGDFTWGYLGGVLDAATGLVYVGNGQYYDPATGRFLSRGVNPGAPNPYVPWQVNPTGMIVGPLALLALIRGKRRAGKMDRLLVLVIVVFAVSMTISGCDSGDDRETIPQPPSTPTSTPTEPKPDQSGSDGTSKPTHTPTRTPTPTPSCTPTSTATPTPSPFEKGYFDREAAVKYALENKGNMSNAVMPSDCTNFVSYALASGGLKQTETWNPQNPDGGPWVNTYDLFVFLTKIGFAKSTQFTNTPDYRDDSGPKINVSNYLLLRENTPDMKKVNGVENNVWADFVKSSNAQRGDLVFYRDQSWNDLEWSHVAIVTSSITTSTNFATTLKGPKEPLVVDHDGPTENNPNWLPRSMGDTDGEYIKSVIVLHAP